MEENIAVQENMAADAPQDFDALLRRKDFQSEFDRRVSRALETARGKWEQDTQRRIEQARAEAEAMARMSGEERMEHDFAQREARLAEREQEILRRELHAQAARMIQERGLPAELAGAVNYASAEDVQQSLEALEGAFRSAVQNGVEARMRGSAPAAARRSAEADESDADYYRMRFAPEKQSK